MRITPTVRRVALPVALVIGAGAGLARFSSSGRPAARPTPPPAAPPSNSAILATTVAGPSGAAFDDTTLTNWSPRVGERGCVLRVEGTFDSGIDDPSGTIWQAFRDEGWVAGVRFSADGPDGP